VHSITAVDLDHNFDAMRNAWDPQQPIESLFEQIQDYVYFSEAGGVTIRAAPQISVTYTKVFGTGILMSTCRHWNEKDDAERNWNNFKIHFSEAYRQHKQMQG
jgi:hypothetical protein